MRVGSSFSESIKWNNCSEFAFGCFPQHRLFRSISTSHSSSFLDLQRSPHPIPPSSIRRAVSKSKNPLSVFLSSFQIMTDYFLLFHFLFLCPVFGLRIAALLFPPSHLAFYVQSHLSEWVAVFVKVGRRLWKFKIKLNSIQKFSPANVSFIEMGCLWWVNYFQQEYFSPLFSSFWKGK